jgi:opacity protein-like surface antigen
MGGRRSQVLAGPFALAHGAVRFEMFSSNRLTLRRPGFACPLALIGIGATIVFSTSPALAYRPFDGTDAAVADVKEVEIEFQPFGWQRDDQQKTLITPGVRFNYGFAEGWEFVAEGQLETPLSPFGPSSFSATGAFLKYVLKPGVLQDQTGLSIATEFGPLLPEVNGDRGTGFSWAGIVSQRWEWGAVHVNVEANLTRDQQGEAFIGAIFEGPAKWKVRPVVEVFYDKVWTQTKTWSALAGAIWQVRDNLSFDAAFRYAVVNGRPVNEIRAGLTFAFSVADGKSETRPGITFGNWGLSR